MAIIVPVLGKAKEQARAIVGMNNQKQVVSALNLFALDNSDRYPQSVATMGFGPTRGWMSPAKLIGPYKRSGEIRSVSTYLKTYIPDADIIHCPSAPRKFSYLQECWDSGEAWDYPGEGRDRDPVVGTYCFYWGYTGYIGGHRVTWQGPRTPAAGGMQSKLLITDYFAYDNMRNKGAYTSCEKSRVADVVPEYYVSSPVWSIPADPNMPVPNVQLRSGYTDGHVETYSTSEAVLMEVLLRPALFEPYPPNFPRPGVFYLPPSALY